MALRKVKGFQIQVELQIQTVNCPGVWLCPNGNVSLQISMLDSCTQTATVPPLFPLLIQEKFVFYKTFFGVNKLTTLQKRLSKEYMYVELIQWKRYEDVGNVLAIFQTSVADLLFPGNSYVDYFDIDLLMEPMKNFPGILSPKIEVSTKTIIEDKLLYDKSLVAPADGDYYNSYVANCESAFVLHPKLMLSNKTNRKLHDKRVCHSATYRKCQPLSTKHQSCCCSKCHHQSTKKPPFVFKRVQDDLICRKPEFNDPPPKPTTKCNSIGSKIGRKYCKNTHISCVNHEECACCDTCPGSLEACAVCAKYKYYFENTPSIKSKNNISCELKCSLLDKKMRCGQHTTFFYFLTGPLPKCAQQQRRSSSVEATTRLVEHPTAFVKRCRCEESERRSPSLAETMHRRLKETLDVCPQPALFDYFSAAHHRFCDCLSARRDSWCTPNASSSIGNFCKNFYGKSKAAYTDCLNT